MIVRERQPEQRGRNDGDMQQPVAIVTGAAQGIGKSIADKLARQGASVIVVDNNPAKGQRTVEKMRIQGLDVEFFAADVGNVEDVRGVVGMVEHEYRRLDWIVNNAGISKMKPIDVLNVEEFERVIDVNLKAAFMFAKFGAPLLRKSPGAAIVNISSTRALMSEPHNEAYAAAKAGLLGLTHALANSLGPEIRVNTICPGWINVDQDETSLRPIDHKQHPVGRVGRPEDIAHITAFLLSSEASFISGQAFVVDGGMTKKMIYVE